VTGPHTGLEHRLDGRPYEAPVQVHFPVLIFTSSRWYNVYSRGATSETTALEERNKNVS
jgi:hypothetical protein